MRKLLLFRVGQKGFGINLPFVRNIHGTEILGKSRSTGHGRSIMMISGEPMPFYDMAEVLNDTSADSNPEGNKVILAAAQNCTLALKVDRVDGVISVNSEQIEKLPDTLGLTSTQWFPNVLKQKDGLTLIIDPAGVDGGQFEIPEIDFGIEPEIEYGSRTEESVQDKTDMEKIEEEIFDPEIIKLENILTSMLTQNMMPDIEENIFPKIMEETLDEQFAKLKKAVLSSEFYDT